MSVSIHRFPTIYLLLITNLSLINHAAIADSDAISKALSLETRSPADLERDKRSRPEAVLRLLQLQPGETVMDIFGGGGYYAEIMANVVGAEGKVLLHNNKAYRNFVNQELTARLDKLDLPQLVILDREVDDFALEPESLDAAMIIMSYHDLYYVDPANGWTAIDKNHFLSQIHAALKPNGRFLIVDHNAAAGTGSSSAQELHRIERAFAIRDIQSSGFQLDDSSSLLRNPDDDYSVQVFDEAVRGKTDRFILLFRKQQN